MAGEGEKREGGEGPSEETEFAEYVEYLKEKYPGGGIKDDESAGRPHGKEWAQREESAEGSSKRAWGTMLSSLNPAVYTLESGRIETIRLARASPREALVKVSKRTA